MTAMCAGCDKPLPPNKGPGRARKWCSEQCRKVTLYAHRCIECGAPCNKDGRAAHPALRCKECGFKRTGEIMAGRARDRAEGMLELRRAGWMNTEIAREFATTPFAVSRSLSRLRRQGVDVPRAPYDTNRSAYPHSSSYRSAA